MTLSVQMEYEKDANTVKSKLNVHADYIIVNRHQISGLLANEIMMSKALCVVRFMSY